MANRPPTNVWLGNLGHRDGGLNPRMQTDALHGRLQGQRVDYRSQHAHIVGGGAVHAARGSRLATPEIAAADDHAHLHAARDHRRHLAGDGLDGSWVNAEGRRALHGLPAQLEQDATKAQLAVRSAVVAGAHPPPSSKRAIRRMTMFSPSLAMPSVTRFWMVLSLSLMN